MIEIKIFFMLIGIVLGFILTWSFVGDKYWKWKFYKSEYERFYEKWFNTNKRANNAYWYLLKRWNQNEEMDDLCKKAYFELSYWYEGEND